MLAKPSFEPSVATTWRVGIELHAEAARVIGRLGAAQARNALARPNSGRCAACRASPSASRRCACGVGRSGLPMPRSMMSAPALRALALSAVDLLEDVGRQTADAVKFFHGNVSLAPELLRVAGLPSDVERSALTAGDAIACIIERGLPPALDGRLADGSRRLIDGPRPALLASAAICAFGAPARPGSGLARVGRARAAVAIGVAGRSRQAGRAPG